MLQIKINDTLYDIPADLSEITLGKFLEFYTTRGIELDKQLTAILDREYGDDFDRHIDLSQHEDLEALSWFSFWTGQDLSQAAQVDAFPLILLYRSIKKLLTNSEEASYELPVEIPWMEQTWEISDFKVTPSSAFSFNELITSKEVVRQIKTLGQGRWQSLPYLCAVFLRLQGEKFSDQLIGEGSERMELFQSLPMDIAIKVAFFLSVSLNTYRKVFLSSAVPAVAVT
jgi:hypothetical protein